jgi:hypothetical protein
MHWHLFAFRKLYRHDSSKKLFQEECAYGAVGIYCKSPNESLITLFYYHYSFRACVRQAHLCNMHWHFPPKALFPLFIKNPLTGYYLDTKIYSKYEI